MRRQGKGHSWWAVTWIQGGRHPKLGEGTPWARAVREGFLEVDFELSPKGHILGGVEQVPGCGHHLQTLADNQ